jgi:muramoyltetrapeptide carboxypeptidase
MPAKPKIHLTALASGLASETRRLGLKSPADLVKLVQQRIGADYRVTGTPAILDATQDPLNGGRRDDPQRARELQKVLKDENVRALVAIRGGAWFTRVIPKINFEILARRKSPLYIFGFSEMTTLVNIASAYPWVVAVHDLCPGFCFGGLARYAQRNIEMLSSGIVLAPEGHHAFAAGWAAARFKDAFLEFFDDAVEMIEGRPSRRGWTGRVVSGIVPKHEKIHIVGGNLSLLGTLLGAKAHRLDLSGKWLAVEDLNEDTENIDRMLAGMKLAGWLDEAAGIIVGDFHTEKDVLTDAVIALLKNLVPHDKPVIRLNEFGHIWPLSPLPINRPVTLVRRGKTALTLEIPWKTYGRS